MPQLFRPVLGVLLCVLFLAPAHAQEKRLRTFVDALEQPVLSEPQLSPDGKQIAFVIDRADWKANRRIGHIVRINADGSGQTQLTFGERGESSPRWSPDGKALAFVARRDPDTANQIYVLQIAGGEARKITSHASATGNITWAPDGKSIYFTASDAKSAEERERDRVQDDVFAFEETNYKQRHLWNTDLDGKTKRITEGNWSIGGYELTADGARLAMHRVPSPLLEFSDRS
jgi:Tol biopolymer transport system component